MKCPIDGTTLALSERGGVEIDFCPKCRGVWLDRGELDKIINQAVTTLPPRDESGYTTKPRKKRDSFLKELFDF
jgi:uncharacterized protein